MKAYQVTKPSGIEGLSLVQLPEPQVGPGEVMVRIRACSLNYRDLGILHGGYYRNDKLPVVPLSDMAGVVEAIGSGVQSFKVGDRVTASFLRDWTEGAPTDSALRSGFGGGNRAMFAGLLSFIQQHSIEPIIDRAFEFDEAKQAYQYLVSQQHLGKVVIRIGQ
jgi:NADPH:quinone reductase-like Zn-dependent oxidoreductase